MPRAKEGLLSATGRRPASPRRAGGPVAIIRGRGRSHQSGGEVMSVHDWSRVEAGIFHHFHHVWLVHLCDALNNTCLPPGYYALIQPVSCVPLVPSPGEAVTRLPVPPPARFTAPLGIDEHLRQQKSVVIYHSEDERIIAVIEVVAPGNKNSRYGMRSFVERAVVAVLRGIHLLILDLVPPGPRDPKGIHPLIQAEFCEDSYEPPAGKPLTLVAYAARRGERRTSSRLRSATGSPTCRSFSRRSFTSRCRWRRPIKPHGAACRSAGERCWKATRNEPASAPWQAGGGP